MAITFNDEGDVRRWVRKINKGITLWVEAALGGSHGFPDTVCVHEGVVIFMELKVGEILPSGMVQFEMHNSQRIILRKLHKAGAEAIVIVGERGGKRLWAAQPTDIFPKVGDGDVDVVKGRIPHLMHPEIELDQEDRSWLGN